MAESLFTRQKGYIPQNFVAKLNRMKTKPWFFKNLSRNDATRQLLALGNTQGSFLIRESETTPGSFSLSVRDLDHTQGDVIKHYRIRNLDAGGFYITTKISFSSLSELVKHYSREADGLCTRLVKPCQTRAPQKPWWQDEWEVPRKSLNLERRLGQVQFGEVWMENLVVAIYKYEPCHSDDLGFEKGEKMKILNADDPEWYMAESLFTGQKGYIPQNFVAKLNSMETEPWFFKNLSRNEAIRQLLAPGNTQGSFLIRESETTPGSFSLSVRDLDHTQGDVIKHYRIRNLDAGGFNITTKISFNSLSKLVKHYSREADGLCTRLVKPCQTRAPQKSWWQDEWINLRYSKE